MRPRRHRREREEPADRRRHAASTAGSRMRPRSMRTTRSARAASSRSWATSSTVLPTRSLSIAAIDQRRARGVEIRRRLVEEDERRVAQEGAREREPASLPCRELSSAVPDDRLVALAAARIRSRARRRARRRDVRDRRRPPDLRAGCCPRSSRGRASGAAGRTRAAHATPAGSSAARSLAADQDPPGRRLREAQEQRQERALPAPARPDERNRLAWAKLEIDARGGPPRHVLG